jgi:hypothetical protein
VKVVREVQAEFSVLPGDRPGSVVEESIAERCAEAARE